MRANWGGRRPGSGRKKLTPEQKAVRARAKNAGRVLAHPSSAGLPATSQVTPPTTDEPSPFDEFDAPNDLGLEERQVWLKQAPHAFKNRTLTRASALAFERYCRVVVMERNEANSSGRGGPNHRGLLKQVNSYELQFLLTPCGKPMVEPPAAPVAVVDENDAYFGGPSVNRRA